MKTFITIAVLLVASLGVSSADDRVCYNHVVDACAQGVAGVSECNSKFGGISYSLDNLNEFLHMKLSTSFDYMLLQTHFDSYQKNRPGFKKLFNGLSDQSWDETVGLIKHVTKRGGTVDFSGLGKKQVSAFDRENKNKVLELDELQALALSLDAEKVLGNSAFKVHQHASHMQHKEDKTVYDPEITQYMEEHFLEKQASTIRKLSGYANDLKKLMQVRDPSLNVYLFDEYLAKQ